MNDAPLISIAMGIYNCKSTLKEAVESIQNQTYQNWELIMCDDASTDGTYEFALELAKSDNRIKVLKNETNLTLAPTLNKCIKESKGEFIARMDGDDICPPTRLEKEINFLLSHPEYALVSVWMDMFDENGLFNTIKYTPAPLAHNLLKGSQFCHAGCMIRKDALESVGGYSESSDYKRVEDFDLWVRLYHKGYKGYNLQEPLYAMRDDRNAYKRRNWSSRLNEARVRKSTIKYFDLPIKSYIHVAVPIIKFFVPSFVYKIAHKQNKYL